MSMFTFKQFNDENVAGKKRLITEQALRETFPEGLALQLQFPFRASKVINRIIEEYIATQVTMNVTDITYRTLKQDVLTERINEIFNEFRPGALQKIAQLRPTIDALRSNPQNLYALAGATELTFANKVSRTLSTTMGPLWEKIAKISPHVVDPETDFGIRIPGVDIIYKNIETGVVEYAQLKTQRNTLTGGQSGRVDAELSLHDNPVFCACFLTSPGWTYNTKRNISRLAGAEFWSRVGIDYDVVVERLTGLILSLEDGFVDMLTDS